MAQVITYQYAYLPGTITLCTSCEASWDGATLSTVSHGRRDGICEQCGAGVDEIIRKIRDDRGMFDDDE